MWTTENRCRYDRSHLRYPSDLTDEEWALVEPLIPPARRGGNKRTVDMRARSSTGSCISSARAASGRRCRRICLRAARSTATSCTGTMTAHSIDCTTRSTSSVASDLGGSYGGKLGDDGGLKAAYRGGCRACQNLSERAIRHEHGLPTLSGFVSPMRSTIP